MNYPRQLVKEYEKRMIKDTQWEDYIKPLFEAEFGCKYYLGYEPMYRQEIKDWLAFKKIEFPIVKIIQNQRL